MPSYITTHVVGNFKSHRDGITAFNTEKDPVARKHLNWFLTLSIHFVACCFGLLPSALPPLTIATGLIGSNDKIRLHSRKNSVHTIALHVLNKGSVDAAKLRYPFPFFTNILCIHLWLMIVQKIEAVHTFSTDTGWHQPLMATVQPASAYDLRQEAEVSTSKEMLNSHSVPRMAVRLWCMQSLGTLTEGWGQMNNALWIVQQRLSTLAQCILYSLCLSLSHETCSIFISSVTN